jgi:hypothetical protein
MGAEGGQIEFFVSMPREFLTVFQTKLRNHDGWAGCTLAEVGIDALGIPGVGSYDLYSLGLQRSNMFSLSTDHTTQTAPLRDLLQVSREMQAGEYVGMLTRLEAVPRAFWRSTVDGLWRTWDQGSVPGRDTFSPGRMAVKFGILLYQLFGEIKYIAEDIMRGINKSLFNGSGEEEHQKIEIIDPERAALLVNGALSRATYNKRNLPAYRTDIELIVGGETAPRRAMLAHSVLSGINSEMGGDNRLRLSRICTRFGHEIQNLRVTWERDPNVLSCDEVGKMLQLPTKDIQDEFGELLQSNKRTEVEVPKIYLGEGLFCGTTTNRGDKYNISLPTNNMDHLMTPRVVMGSPRMGKDQHTINLIVEAKRKHGIGAWVLDVIDEREGHRGMANAIRDHLPPEDVIDLNLGDWERYPVYVGPLCLAEGGEMSRALANTIAGELTQFSMGDDWANHQTREYVREACKASQGDLLGMVSMFVHPGYRKTILGHLCASGRDTTLWDDYDKMSEGKQGQIAGPILVRLGELMGDDALRLMFCQRPSPELRLLEWTRQGKVIIFRAPKRGGLTQSAIQTLAHWITLTCYLIKLRLGTEGAGTFLVLNEPHQFITPGLTQLLSNVLVEGPKMRLAPIVVFHNFKQLPGDFVQILMSASLNWHIFANTNDEVYRRLEFYLQPTFSPEEAQRATGRYQYILANLTEHGDYATPILVNALPLVGDRYPTQDNSWLTLRHSRQYGRPAEEVEAEIMQRRRSA